LEFIQAPSRQSLEFVPGSDDDPLSFGRFAARKFGTSHAVAFVMAVSNYRDLIAWQLAAEFRAEVIRLLRGSQEAWRNVRFRDQLVDAASSVPANLAEGFRRFSPREFCKFIDYSLASLAESEERLITGVELGYFTREECSPAFQLARRCLTAAIRLKQSQRRFIQTSYSRSSRKES
jgi:four helix bundle protein